MVEDLCKGNHQNCMGNSGIAIVVKRRVMAFRPGPISHRELFSKTEIVMINSSVVSAE